MRILIVEDDPISRMVMQKNLKTFGICDLVENGREALEAFEKAHQENSPYGLIALDIMMPEMDGQTALQEIRRMEEERGIHGLSGVKVIMTTALDDKDNIMRAFKSQCEGYLTKPIQRQKLFQLMDELGLSGGPDQK
ncbi:two-component system chemotaxis response regulator CheY [Desulfobotulus alkaliphilus]|uniref:Two-component system chemotaxis response regulator CheY n=1 Tax=Desulfobotulus alkaliphilus TaxID=622671 RepID=A0A562S8M1_9BACT|nr:response regulator [Desulfobotulus alkaliphilus]TWI76800.1 two-component system chemotaxis response regulator CheY [Desulfobotulus alkaliphilus]